MPKQNYNFNRELLKSAVLDWVAKTHQKQKDLAPLIGLSPCVLSQYIQGSRQPDKGNLRLISEFFHIPAEEFLSVKGEEPPIPEPVFAGIISVPIVIFYNEDGLQKILVDGKVRYVSKSCPDETVLSKEIFTLVRKIADYLVGLILEGLDYKHRLGLH